jgi:hypothetical protein
MESCPCKLRTDDHARTYTAMAQRCKRARGFWEMSWSYRIDARLPIGRTATRSANIVRKRLHQRAQSQHQHAAPKETREHVWAGE